MHSSFHRRTLLEARFLLTISSLGLLTALSGNALAQSDPLKKELAPGSPDSPSEPAPATVDDKDQKDVDEPRKASVAASPTTPPSNYNYPPPYPPPEPLPQPEPEPDPFHRDHFEITMGFLVGQRSYTKSRFQFDDGNAGNIGGGQLVEPFEKAPFDKVTVMGLRYDMRLVISYVRLLAGFDFPFPSYRTQDATGTYTIQGTQRTVTVQSLSAKELRFGLGAEYPYKSIAVFADLIGGVHWSSAEFAIDGSNANYSATDFAFSGRGGIRLHVRPWFFASLSGEVGIIGDIVWNGDMSVGFAFP